MWKPALVVAALVLFSCGGSSEEGSGNGGATSHEMTVEVAQQEPACLSYSGTPVVVRDADNTVVGSVTLPPPTEEPNTGAYAARLLGDTITVASAQVEVPDSAFYQIEVQGVTGAVTFQKAELDANGWVAGFICG